MATPANWVQRSLPGPRALQGRIEAIGICELLRVATAHGITGILRLSGELGNGEVGFVRGRPVQVHSGGVHGVEALSKVLRLSAGDFEYRVDESLCADEPDSRLAEALSVALAIVAPPSERSSAHNSGQQRAHVPSVSGVHRVAECAGRLVTGEIGRARIDLAGRHLERAGQISIQDTACAGLLTHLSREIARDLGLGALQSLEVCGQGACTLLCRLGPAGAIVSKVTEDGDLALIGAGLDP